MSSNYVLIRSVDELTERLEYLKVDLVRRNAFPVRLDIKKYVNKRSLNQNALVHFWFAEIAEYLTSRGRETNEVQVKLLMKHKFLGYEDIELGSMTIERQLRETSGLDTGEMFQFMEQIDAWSSGIGVRLTIPVSSEYRDLMEKQHE
jgi:hypothetical protein